LPPAPGALRQGLAGWSHFKPAEIGALPEPAL